MRWRLQNFTLGCLFFGCFWTLSALAQEQSDASCKLPTIPGVLQPVERSDLEVAAQIVAVETESVTLSGPLAGLVIDASCLEGDVPLKERALRRERIEVALLRMLERFSTCDAFLKIPDFAQAKALLKNTRIVCANDATHAAIGRSVITVELPGGITQAAGSLAEAPLRITLNSAPDAPDNRLDTPSGTLSGLGARWSVDNLASILAHELLHGTSNSTQWHTENRAQEFEQTGCTQSLFADRIYGVAAICFPHSEHGLSYFEPQKGAANCPAVCESALGKIDSEVVDQLKVDAGQSLVAAALTPADATNRCAKVQKLAKYVGDRSDALAAARKKILNLRVGWMEQEPPQAEWAVLTRRATFLLDWIYRLKEGYERASEARAVLKKERNMWRLARSPQAPELLRILDEIEKWVDPPPPDGFELFSRSLVSPENPKLP